ncbi:accessory factor associated with RNA polymerase II [Cladophialophora chaetospira]|uniref:Accessory factor associated with RNA polymerase II n=1 Tax=Cladophialophora chaetospira TaxID=386627 RepID=A0AA38X9P7_9EURO|nr:accessory factor associated with RNA polymerase II [Cladophialophora chaetospira]
MATPDALQLLRSSIAVSKTPVLTKSSDPSEAESNQTESLVEATHLYFTHPSAQCLPLDTKTRFESTNPDTSRIDLRSIFFAWQQKDVPVPEYISRAAELDKQLPEGQKVRNLVFVERLDLITWLEGASEESEYIKPIEGAAALQDAVNRATDVAGGAAVPTVGGTGVGVTQTAGGRPVKVIDARLQVIYNGERRMGDHNTVLRGIKPTDFSHVRKHAETFLGRRKGGPSSSRPGGIPSKPASLATRPAANTSKPLSSAVSSKRSDPIILLSPSASSLLRMSNIKTFLDTGLFVPPDHPTLSTQTTANLLHITRTMPSLGEKPFRFILVDSPEHFKPDYWSRVVAVFTTGQIWQFRGYKWREPQELFGHVLGIYVGEKGLPIPTEVKGWGSSVKSFAVDRWDERAHGASVEQETRMSRRWRDRETVEEVWRGIEGYMRGRGEWKR